MTSVSLRITLGFSAVVTFTTAVLLVLGAWILSGQMVRGLELLNEAEFHELEERLDGHGTLLTSAQIHERINEHMILDASLYYSQVHTEDGQVLYRSPNLGDAIMPMAADRERDHWTATVPPFGAMHISEFRQGPLHIQIASPLEPTRRLLGQYAKVSGLLLACAAVASLVLGAGFARFTLGPVRAITATAQRIRADNLSERIPVSRSGDELSRLAQLLNQMFDRLEASFQQVNRFSADASHELKTPLSLIRLNAEKLRSQIATNSAAATAVDDLLEEISRLQQIIETLLFLSKAESGALTLQRKREPTDVFINNFAEDGAVLAEDVQVRFDVEHNDASLASFEPNLLRQLLLNLLTNALAVSPPGAKVVLHSCVERQLWVLTLLDEGPGLPQNQLERVFERFVRWEQPDGAARRGHGLGLAICRSIAQLHGGHISAENRADGPGLKVRLELPVS